MQNSPKISVVILNYNGLKYLEKTIPAILSFNYPNFEIVVVDNKSKDESKDYIKKYNNIVLVENEENFGYSKGKNIGVLKSTGEYLLLIDEDMYFEDKDALNKLYDIYRILPNIAFLNPLIVDAGKNESKYYGNYFKLSDFLSKKDVSVQKLIAMKEAFQICCPHGGALFIKRSTWVEIGGIDESQPYMIDDYDLGLRANLLGYKNFLTTRVVSTHLGVTDRTKGAAFNWKYKYYFSGIMRMVIKNFNITSLFGFVPLFICFSLFKTLKQFAQKRDIRIFQSYFQSIGMFSENFWDTLKERTLIQDKRKIKKDTFLSIRPPTV